MTHAEFASLGPLGLLVSRWDGPVSVAIHAPDAEFGMAVRCEIGCRNSNSSFHFSNEF